MQQPPNASSLNAPDLQLDCLSSDTDEDVGEEDVTVVKISRRRTKGSGSSRHHSRRWHNSTTTINAPPGSIVEVDLTQESDHPEDDEDLLRNPNAGDSRGTVNSEGVIKLRQFATVPHLPPNVQSRGSTPSTTPAPPVPQHSAVPGPSNVGAMSSAVASAAAASAEMQYWSSTDPHSYDHAHPCNGECSLFPHQHHPDYPRPRRLRQPYHHQVGCQDAHCRNHHRSTTSSQVPYAYGAMGPDQPLDCRAAAAASAAAASGAGPSGLTGNREPAPGPSGVTSTSSTSSAAASSSRDPGGHDNAEPPSSQRLINAVWRMQYHHPLRPRMHPRHQRLWQSCQYQQELMRRHMGSAAGSNPAPAHHAPPDYPSMYQQAPPIPAPMPAHLGMSILI